MAAAAPSESSAQLRRSVRPRVQTHSKAARFPAQQQSCAQRGFHPHPRRPPENIGPGASVRAGPESASPGCYVPGSCRAGLCSGRPGGGSSAVRWPASLPPAAGFGTSGRRNLLWWGGHRPPFLNPPARFWSFALCGPSLSAAWSRPVGPGLWRGGSVLGRPPARFGPWGLPVAAAPQSLCAVVVGPGRGG